MRSARYPETVLVGLVREADDHERAEICRQLHEVPGLPPGLTSPHFAGDIEGLHPNVVRSPFERDEQLAVLCVDLAPIELNLVHGLNATQGSREGWHRRLT